MHAAPRVTALLVLVTLAAGVLHAPRAASTEWRAVMADCDGCSDYEFRLLASMLGHGDHHIYSISSAQLRRFVIDRPNPPIPLGATPTEPREAVRLAAMAIEQPPLPAVQAIFDDMVALDRADPGFWTKGHEYSVPLGEVTSGSTPAEIGLARPSGSFPGGSAFNNFMSQVRNLLWANPSTFGPAVGARASFWSRINQIGITGPTGFGVNLGWPPRNMGPVRVAFTDANGDRVIVNIDPNAEPITVEFVDAVASTGDSFPPENRDSDGSATYRFDNQVARDRFVGPLEAAGIPMEPNPVIRYRSYTVTCAYVGGRLIGCRVDEEV